MVDVILDDTKVMMNELINDIINRMHG